MTIVEDVRRRLLLDAAKEERGEALLLLSLL
jgi:hypothetical protein